MGTGPTPQEQQMQKEIQQLQQLLAQQHQEIAEAKLRATGKTDLRQVEAYNAETKRMEVLRQAFVNDPAELQQIIHKLVQESMATVLAAPPGQNQAPDSPPMQQQSGPPPMAPPRATGIQVPLGQPLPGAPTPIQVNPNG
jgi:DNA-binding protein YbaB